MRSTGTRGGVIGAALAIAAVMSVGPWPAVPALVIAAPGAPILDVELDVDTVTVGATVTLIAWIFDADGSPLTGPATNTQVRFYFAAGSANDPGGSGNNADLQCHTGQAGTCSVTYVPVYAGVDVLCAKTSNGPASCTEAVGAAERVDEFDSVQRTVVAANPSPNTEPSPSPSPSAAPSPSPSVDPSPSAAPSPSADPSPSPEPSPAAQPSPSPSTEPSPSPSADPSPSVEPSPSASPGQDPGPSAPPSSDPGASPGGNDDPSPAPTDAPTEELVMPASEDPSEDPSAAPIDATPSASPDPEAVTAAVIPSTGSDADTGGTAGTGGTGGPAGDGVRAPVADRPSAGLSGAVDAIVDFAVDGASRVLRPEAAAAVATTFGFPIALALLVLLFLLVQSRLDDRDPKLRSAPLTMADTLVAFEDDVR